MVSFAVYVLSGTDTLTPSKAFVSLSLFNILRFPMTDLPMVASFMVRVSENIFAPNVKILIPIVSG